MTSSEKKPVFKLLGLTEEHRQFLKDHAKKTHGTENMTRAIIDLINEKMGKNGEEAFASLTQDKTPALTKTGRKQRKKMQLSLVTSDYDNLEKLAKNSDSSPQNYTISLIRNHLYKGHELLGNEIEVLRKSNYELHKIGVNVNQIAKALNMGEQANLPINQLHQQIVKHVEKVEQILKDNLDRY
nr:plasmid mobilization relaxosome protein MobC [Moraxella osloensis]